MKNAIRVASEFAAAGINEKIEAELGMLSYVSGSKRRSHAALSPEQNTAVSHASRKSFRLAPDGE